MKKDKPILKYKTSKTSLKLSKQYHSILDELCFYSKNIYNSTLYEIRKHFFETGKYLQNEKVYHIIKKNENYKLLPAQVAQQTTHIVDRNMKSFFGLLKLKEKGLYQEKVQLPKYKNKKSGRFALIYTPDLFKVDYEKRKLRLSLPKSLKERFGLRFLFFDFPKYIKQGTKIKEIRILPKAYSFEMEIVYINDEQYQQIKHYNNFISIDLGVNNLLTIYDEKSQKSFIIDGKQMKSYNQYFNKEISKRQSSAIKANKKYKTKRIFRLQQRRKNKLRNDLHLISGRIVRFCLENDIGNIVIGYNQEWKQNSNIGRKNNKKFQNIPFAQLINFIDYKSENHGIRVFLQEESYTSKCSAVDLEPVWKQEEYLGKRIKRGLFRSANGKAINADLNGSLNILRKFLGENRYKEIEKSKAEFYLSNLEDRIGNRGAVPAPKRIRVAELEKFNFDDQSSLEEKVEFVKKVVNF